MKHEKLYVSGMTLYQTARPRIASALNARSGITEEISVSYKTDTAEFSYEPVEDFSGARCIEIIGNLGYRSIGAGTFQKRKSY